MKKRILYMVFVSLWSMFMLLGCGDNQEQSKENGEKQQEEQEPLWTKQIMQRSFLKWIEPEEVLTITFLDTLENEPEDSWDVSVTRDGSVKAWSEEDDGFHHVYIGAEGGMCIEDCNHMFAEFLNLVEIRFNDCFHTDYAMDMSSMFYGCEKLERVDVDGFVTNYVLDMSSMFSGCSSLQMLDVSGFCMEYAKNMSWMFYGCKSLTALDVSGFDTSKVTDMRGMFSGCESLIGLDVSGFKFCEDVSTGSMLYQVPQSEVIYEVEQLPDDAWDNEWRFED